MRAKLASFLRNGVGATGLLWAPCLHLLHEAFTPPPHAALLAVVFLLGVLLQALLYAVANRGFFIGARPPWKLAAAAGGLALGAAALAGGVPLAWHAVASPGRAIDAAALGFGAALLIALQARVFTRRVAFRAMVVSAEEDRARARAASRVLLPAGSFRLDRVLARLEASAEDGPRETSERLRALAQELRLRWDDRFDRPVPWLTAASLVSAFLELVAARHPHVQVSALERGEQLDAVPVRCAPLCALADVLAERMPPDARLAVASEADGEALRLCLSATPRPNASAPYPAPLLEQLRDALRSGVRVSLHPAETGLQVELHHPPATPPAVGREAVERRFGAAELALLEGEDEPTAIKRVYRRGDEVWKVHFDGGFDPKPTLLEDEFFILRRLAQAGWGLPEVTGAGRQPGYRWLSYRFEPGTPLDAWLEDDANRSAWLHILLDVEDIVRRLTEQGVAHRDLNPGNFIVREDGSPVLIDFDQAVADAPAYRGADIGGASLGTAKNDLASLLDQAGLTRRAHDAVRTLAAHWPAAGGGFELSLAGQVFPGVQPFAGLWYPILEQLGGLAGRRVLDHESGAPLFGLFAASHGADVTIRPGSPEAASLARELGAQIGGRLRVEEATRPRDASGFDLAVCLGRRDVVSRLDGLLRERPAALVVDWPDEPASLAERVRSAGLAPPRTIAFTSRLEPLLLSRRE